MSKHLLPETIEQLEQHQLKGETLVEVLLHLNSCPECRQKLPLPSKEEILKRLFADDDDEVDEDDDEPDTNDPAQAEEAKKEANKTESPSWLKKLKMIFK